jgi:hypothetical protein
VDVGKLFVGRRVGDIAGTSNCLAAQRLDFIVEICCRHRWAVPGKADGHEGDLALQSSQYAASLRRRLSAPAQASSWSNIIVAASSWMAATGRKLKRFSTSLAESRCR